MMSTDIEKVINLNEDQVYHIRSDEKKRNWTIYAGCLVHNIPRTVKITQGEKTYVAFLKKVTYTETSDKLTIVYKTDWHKTNRGI